ncbi:hypothetical protein N9Y17_01270 [Gammaproteobacteria bacterium]|nr:hypothetical protein [Gammaproteobacteria bacterium]
MKQIKALKNPQSVIDPKNLTHFGLDLFAGCTTEDEKLDKLIDFFKKNNLISARLAIYTISHCKLSIEGVGATKIKGIWKMICLI